MILDYTDFYKIIENTPIKNWKDIIPKKILHGDFVKWEAIISNLPEIQPSIIQLNTDTIRIGKREDISDIQYDNYEKALRQLYPWRKGPYNLFSIKIDTEWRSDWKWKRLKNHITPLKNKIVLDVGCGNGYHCWRMAGEGTDLVIGIDPYLLFVMQFFAIKHFIKNNSVFVLPVGIEEIPKQTPFFDTVFSMGVFYHRRSPFDHLYELKALLKPGGELVLETLIIEGTEGEVLVPQNRYAKMRNVWFIPTADTIIQWLRRVGFKNVRLVNITRTTIEEQRSTDWMPFESLSDFLDKNNLNKTIEGYPSPARAFFIAQK